MRHICRVDLTDGELWVLSLVDVFNDFMRICSRVAVLKLFAEDRIYCLMTHDGMKR